MMREGLRLQSAALSYWAGVAGSRDARGLAPGPGGTRSHEREMNEDAVYEYSGQAKNGAGIGLYLVCDGFGGHQEGRAASHLAAQTIVDALFPVLNAEEAPLHPENGATLPTIVNQSVKAAIRDANEKVWRLTGPGPSAVRTMGTALTLVAVAGNMAHIANLGHGRVYVWRAGQVQQLTQDDSVAGLLAQLGQIGEAEIAGHPRRKTLLRSLGQKEEVSVDLFKWWLQAGDRLLLCSDGLWNAFSNRNELAEYLGATSAPAEMCHQMVTEARERNGSDDISAVVVTVSDAAEQDGELLWQKIVPADVAGHLAL